MTALVIGESVLLAVLSVLVAGLLRSHAEILRHLATSPEGGDRQSVSGLFGEGVAPPRSEDSGTSPASDVAGVTIDGDAVKITVGSNSKPTLLAFLTTGCDTCERLIAELDLPSGSSLRDRLRVVVVSKAEGQENSGKLRTLLPADLDHVFSLEAWESYDVPGSPYFVYFDGRSDKVHSEGSTVSWDRVTSMLGDAVLAERRPDAALPEVTYRRSETTAERAERAQAALRAEGIKPGDSTLWPNRNAPEARGAAGGAE